MTPDVCCRFIEHNYKVVPIASQIGGKATADLPKTLYKDDDDDELEFNDASTLLGH